ncbi:hypothetical protein PR202_ga17609 [Eleusine coracana subsp. coracana]|uniref:Uncharacterized protein n=1 Tax=Eleusine coracana subsp. coracana TaxID=191504 RepID=A0AAV5CQE3_ELECO|nr:hypothetical protein PR202_ga17362 [Eleusine coracana subsp. coracana]GJN00427.1 hypothetical protein PR202_ga17609 [Eleusine coracana subsp. coracana]
MFHTSVKMEVGDGQVTLFWQDRWIQCKCIEQLAPWVFQAVPAKLRRSRTVADAFTNATWIRDIRGARTVFLIRDFLTLLNLLDPIQLTPGRNDQFIWRWLASGEYSASTAYNFLFQGQFAILGAKELCKVRAPAKIKFIF